METIDTLSGSSRFRASREEHVKPGLSFDGRTLSVNGLLIDFLEHSAGFLEMCVYTLMHP
jgi:hypothetical protein